jgi:hypothetical protein
MARLQVHKRWNAQFLRKQLDIRVTEYAGLDPERYEGFVQLEKKTESEVFAYADGSNDTPSYAAMSLERVARRTLRKSSADLFGRRNGSRSAVAFGSWEMVLSQLLRAAYWRSIPASLPPRGYLVEVHEFIEVFCMAMSMGWTAQATRLHHLILGMNPISPLWHKDTFNPRWKEKPRQPWARFTLSLCEQFYGLPPIPKPPHPYESPAFDALLAVWRDPDPAVLTEPLLKVCDWHTHECMYSRSDSPSKNVDFINDVLMGWPVEIHTVFRLREQLGLTLPTTPDHPLMQAPMGAYLPPTPIQMDDRLRRVCARAFREHPGMEELLSDVVPMDVRH